MPFTFRRNPLIAVLPLIFAITLPGLLMACGGVMGGRRIPGHRRRWKNVCCDCNPNGNSESGGIGHSDKSRSGEHYRDGSVEQRQKDVFQLTVTLIDQRLRD